MKAQWELHDKTRVEAKVVHIGKWSVRVNAVEVPSQSTKHSFFSNDTVFMVSPGRQATLSMRKASHGAEIDLHVDGQVLLYPGRRPFRCPSCRSITQSHQRTCNGCGNQLPTRAERLQELRGRSLFAQMLVGPAVFFAILGAGSISTLRNPQAAMAGLHEVQAGWSESELRDYVISSAEASLLGVGLIATGVLALGLLSRRRPLTAAVVSFMLWLGWFAPSAINPGSLTFFSFAFQALLIWSAYRCLRLAIEMRAIDRELRSASPASSPRE